MKGWEFKSTWIRSQFSVSGSGLVFEVLGTRLGEPVGIAARAREWRGTYERLELYY